MKLGRCPRTSGSGDEGFALIAAIIIMMIILGLGLALLSFADAQQKATSRQQLGETAYSIAEAALNAQVFELSVQWPTSVANSQTAFPSSCNQSSAGATYCPNPSGGSSTGSFAAGYSTSGSPTCPSGTPSDPWGAGLSNGWTTYVRGDGGGTSSLFSSTVDQTQPAYDALGDGKLWVRSVGVYNCRSVAMIEKVTEQLVPLNFPQYVVNANGFETGNNGNKQVINTLGQNAQAGQIEVRCSGLSGPGVGTSCTNYSRSVQVSPGPSYASSTSSTALTPTQLAGLKTEAMANSTYYGPGSLVGTTCPSSLAGTMVYIDVASGCNYTFSGSTTINSAASPGFVYLSRGTISLGGSSTFYGIIYAGNLQGCPTGSTTTCPNGSDVVSLHGNAKVDGAIAVDGTGTVQVGDSGGQGGNLVFDLSEFKALQTYAGAIPVPNTFRVLPQGQ